jgi:UDP-N-acetylmuramoyl-L-alanyl-D-glutamate--2,6-diaminopimelate ligase
LKHLNDILEPLHAVRSAGPRNPAITSLSFDSRKAVKGSVFFALRGTRTDGHKFIDAAVEAGAVAIICEKIPDRAAGGISYVQVEDSARALGLAADSFFGHPSGKLRLIGITGTNGKTTVATLLHGLFTIAGYPSGLLSTVRNLVGDRESPATHTTPDPLQVNGLLADMLDAGCTHCFMEVSSHAIHQRRIGGLQFAGGIFTNITHEHLDYHKTFREYIKAKKAFFDALPAEAFALVNRDDRNGMVMVQNCRAEVSTFGLQGPADFKGRLLESHLDGMQLVIDGVEIWSRLVGAFNASNLLAIYGCARLCDLDKEKALTLLSLQIPVKGRFETLRSETGITAIVDYAHTPDALRNVMSTIARFRNGKSQLITVVGAGGDRDRAKRPVMGKMAAEFSQKLILTSDNPRNEKPEDIIRQMMEGIPAEKREQVLSIPDRREAIKTAVMLASRGDIILVAGKGHEEYQEIGGKRIPFSDMKILREYMKST